MASCRALQVTNVSECGLCQSVFSCFYQTVFVSFSLFQVFICVFCIFFYFILTMAVLEPFSQIKKKTEPV